MAEAARTKGSVIYHNRRRSTSRKTLQLLRDNGVEPSVLEYLKTPPTRAQPATLIGDADDELLDAMVAHPIPIEHPFVVTARGTRLARPVDVVREIL